MMKVKPYIWRSGYPYEPVFNCISLGLSPWRPPPTILCAGRSQPSNRKILQLASAIAFNLKILPEPFNSLAGQIARCEPHPLSLLLDGRRGKIATTTNRRLTSKKSARFAFMFLCVAAGLWSCRIRDFDLFLRALSFCLAGISLGWLWVRKKALREWLLGFFFGIALILSSRFGKEDFKFWIQRLASSPATQIVMTKRNRNRRIFKFK